MILICQAMCLSLMLVRLETRRTWVRSTGPTHLSTEEIYPTSSPINNSIMTVAGVWQKDKCYTCTVVPAKSDSDVMFCLQSYQGLIIDRSLVY